MFILNISYFSSCFGIRIYRTHLSLSDFDSVFVLNIQFCLSLFFIFSSSIPFYTHSQFLPSFCLSHCFPLTSISHSPFSPFLISGGGCLSLSYLQLNFSLLSMSLNLSGTELNFKTYLCHYCHFFLGIPVGVS